MKSNPVFLVIVAVLLFSACKKDNDSNKQLYLSKVYEDALLTREYIYSLDKKPLRLNFYSTNTGQSVSAGFRLYDYLANGNLGAVSLFTSASQFFNKYALQYDVNNRVSRIDDLGTDNSIQFYHLLEYNAQGSLASYEIRNGGSNKKTAECFYSYDAQGMLIMTKRYTFPGVNPVLYDSVTYKFDARQMPSHWHYFESLPSIGLPNGERMFYEMLLSDLFYYLSGGPPTQTDFDFTGKEYNREGYLVKQHIRSERDFPPLVSDHEMTYEYTE